MKTAAIYSYDADYVAALLPKFQQALPNHRVVAWADNISAEYLIAWKPDINTFSTPGLEVIFGLGAGVDAFVDADVPESIAIVRLQEAGMGKQMLEIALYAILHHCRDMIALGQGQRNRQWLPASTPKRLPFSCKVGIMGLGQLGSFVAANLAQLGYPVCGYSRSPKDIPAVDCYHGKQLDSFLANSEVLINLLPLTVDTENILDKHLFNKLPRGAYVVNLARGKHLVEQDLLIALDGGQLSGAFLDVFRQEPLPDNHPFWSDQRIIVTPHLAAITLQDQAVQQISRNILAYEAGEAMTGVVDRERGY